MGNTASWGGEGLFGMLCFPLAAVDIVAPAGAAHAAIARAVSVLPHLHLGTVDAQLGVRT